MSDRGPMGSRVLRGYSFGYSNCLKCGQDLRNMVLTYAMCPCCSTEKCLINERHTHTDAQGNVVWVDDVRLF